MPVGFFFFFTQGIHEPSGPSKEYYLLERLVDMAISPYLSNYLYMSHRDSTSGKILHKCESYYTFDQLVK